MQIFSVKNDFPYEFYDEFARFVIAFGRLEYLIKLCVKDLLDQGSAQGIDTAESLVQPWASQRPRLAIFVKNLASPGRRSTDTFRPRENCVRMG